MTQVAQTGVPPRALVLAGGRSRRMGTDKSLLRYGDEPQWRRTIRILGPRCRDICVSIRADQDSSLFSSEKTPETPAFEFLPDAMSDAGPLAGILSAFRQDPRSAWFVVACDLPLLDAATLDFLLRHRNRKSLATAFLSANDGLPEPLCAVYEPAIAPCLEDSYQKEILCPRKILLQNSGAVTLLKLPDPVRLENANTPGDFERLSAIVAGEPRQ